MARDKTFGTVIVNSNDDKTIKLTAFLPSGEAVFIGLFKDSFSAVLKKGRVKTNKGSYPAIMGKTRVGYAIKGEKRKTNRPPAVGKPLEGAELIDPNLRDDNEDLDWL